MANNEAAYEKGLDLWTRKPVNSSIIQKKYVKHLPRQYPPSSDQVVEFYIPGNTTQFIDFSETELVIVCSIVKDDGTDFKYDNAKKEYEYVTPINDLFHTMWQNVELIAGSSNEVISTSNNYYAYKAYIEDLISTTSTEKNNYMKYNQLWYKDSNYAECSNPEETDPSKKNTGLENRWIATNEKKKFRLIGKLRADFCMQDRFLLNGVDVTVRLTPNREAFRLIHNPTNIKASIQISQMYLRLCKVVLNNSVEEGLPSGFKVSAAQYNIIKTDIRMRQLSAASPMSEFDNIYAGEIPSKMILAFVSAEAYNGAAGANPLKFEHLFIRSLTVYLNDESVPGVLYQNLDFTNNDYSETLRELQKIKSVSGKPIDLDITLDDFKNGSALFAIDIEPEIPPNLSVWPIPKTGTVKISISLEKKLTAPMNLLIYGIFPGTVEIDSDRNVLPPQIVSLARSSNVGRKRKNE